jgi:hypothetical protein
MQSRKRPLRWLPVLVASLYAAMPSRAASNPTLEELQAAYDSAAANLTRDQKHIDMLEIVGSDCSFKSGRFICQIGFRSPRTDPERIYLDVAIFEKRKDGGLDLVSGLCRR